MQKQAFHVGAVLTRLCSQMCFLYQHMHLLHLQS